MEPEPTVLDSLRKAVEAMPDDLPLRLHLATMLLQAGQRDEAVRHLGAVLQRDPGNADALGLLREPDPAPPPSPAPPPTPPPEMRPAVIYLNALWQTRTRARSQVIPESDDEPRAQPVRRPGRLPGELSHATFEYLPESQFPGDEQPLNLGGAAAAHRQGTGTRVGIRKSRERARPAAGLADVPAGPGVHRLTLGLPASGPGCESARVRSDISPPVSFQEGESAGEPETAGERGQARGAGRGRRRFPGRAAGRPRGA